MAGLIPGRRARAFARAARSAVDLEHAQAVIVLDADGAAVLLATPDLDTGVLTDALIDLVFAKGTVRPDAATPRRGPHPYTRDRTAPDLG